MLPVLATVAVKGATGRNPTWPATWSTFTSGLCTPATSTRTPALAEGNSLAYFTIRRTADPELVAYQTGVPVPEHLTGKLIFKPDIRLFLRY